MLAQKMSVALLPIMGIVLLLQYEEGEGGFVVGYMVLLAAIFCMSTLSYDVFDNGMAFLMTLLVKRRVYVFEKYVFIIGTAVTAFSGILGQNESTQEIINAIANMPPRLLTIIIPVVVLIVVIVSVAISVKIIENKEY